MNDLLLHISKAPQTIEELDESVLNTARKYSLFPKDETYRPHAGFSHIFA
jgi:Zn-dependent oligopeptidase